ncbi:hypothetical protein V1507DRAFT_444940 [Lipomyces tetrasporus]
MYGSNEAGSSENVHNFAIAYGSASRWTALIEYYGRELILAYEGQEEIQWSSDMVVLGKDAVGGALTGSSLSSSSLPAVDNRHLGVIG